MAAKKDFSKINTSSVYSTIAEATARPEETATEETKVQNVLNVPKAQEEQILHINEVVNAVLDRQEEKGREKKKLKRINMAFSDDNYSYITIMARIKGLSITDFVNEILTESREKNGAVYDKAVELLKEINL